MKAPLKTLICAAATSLILAGLAATDSPGGDDARSKLSALPYLSGYKPVPEKTGLIKHDRGKAFPGLTYYIPRDGAHIVLLDMSGKIIHEWRIELEEFFAGPDKYSARNFLERALLFGNGDVLAIYVNVGLIKLDKNSNLIWLYNKRLGHHDFDLDEEGNIYLLTYENLPGDDRLKMEEPLTVDNITVLNSKGEELKNISILDCFLNSDYASTLANLTSKNEKNEIFHTNTLEIIKKEGGEKFPFFKKGYALISIRHLHTIAVIDLDREKVVWALSGLWKTQHHPTLLDNFNLLLFDNVGNYGMSKVIEFNPLTQEIIWAYRGDPKNDFISYTCGRNQRLPNGNTLITDTESGRLFEVTPANQIVWEFISPLRAQTGDKKVAAISEGIRVKPEQFPFACVAATSTTSTASPSTAPTTGSTSAPPTPNPSSASSPKPKTPKPSPKSKPGWRRFWGKNL